MNNEIYARVPNHSELKITGYLNASKFDAMSKEQVEDFLKKDVGELARKFVHIEWTDPVKVRADYDVVDSYMTTQKRLSADLSYRHGFGVVVDKVETKKVR